MPTQTTTGLLHWFLRMGTRVGELTWHGRWHGPAQGSDGGHGDLFGAVLGGAGVARGHHVGLQQGPFQVDVVVTQGFVHSSQDLETARVRLVNGPSTPSLGTSVRGSQGPDNDLHGIKMEPWKDNTNKNFFWLSLSFNTASVQ